MNALDVPPEFIVRTTHLLGAFKTVAEPFGHPREVIETLVAHLPGDLRSSPTFLDRLTGMWRYQYGQPYDRLPNDQTVSGTDRWPAVLFLYIAAFTAHLRLERTQLHGWLARLGEPTKHLAVLMEMRPAAGIPRDVSAHFEVNGYGAGNRTLDWLINPAGGRPLLLDVKDRTVSLLKQLNQIMPALQDGTFPQKPLSPDPDDLFRDTVDKFRPMDPQAQLQGVWIHTRIKEDRDRLQKYFDDLDEKRLQFAVLGGWEPDVTILARNEDQRKFVAATLRVQMSDRFVCREYADSLNS
jgi:hypothetical protein